MSMRIGAALRRELPRIDELRSTKAALPDAEGEELALRVPQPVATSAASVVALDTPAPPVPDVRALASVAALAGRLAEPRMLASFGDSAPAVKALTDSLHSLLALGQAVERTRRSAFWG